MLNTKLNSTAPHDIIPAHVLKVIDCYVEFFTDLKNSFLLKGVFPSSLKPGIKLFSIKRNKENEIENNRLVTNIRTMSKIVQKCVRQQRIDYFD